MNELLSNPAIQSGIIPLIVAIVVALVLKRFKGYWAGLSFVIAYYLSVYLTVGFQLYPFTSTRKILIVGLVGVVLGLLVDAKKINKQYLYATLLAVAAGSALWVIWPLLLRQEGLMMFVMPASALAYVAWTTLGANQFRDRTDRAAMLALALGLGTGISAILGASALVGQLGIAIGAIAGAILLLSLFKQNVKLGSTFTLPAGLLSGLLGVGAVIYASLPWYSLIPLAAIPLTGFIQIPDNLNKIKSLFILAAVTLPFPVIAIALAWFSGSGEESMY